MTYWEVIVRIKLLIKSEKVPINKNLKHRKYNKRKIQQPQAPLRLPKRRTIQQTRRQTKPNLDFSDLSKIQLKQSPNQQLPLLKVNTK